MRRRVLIKRYCLALISAVETEEDFREAEKALQDFQSLLESEPDLQRYLTTPFLPAKKRLEIAQEILKKIFSDTDSPSEGDSPSAKSMRFILLLVENERLSLLPEILENLPLLWNEEHGISTFEVASAIPLSSEQKTRLEHHLKKLEGRAVFLRYTLDPSLIGGLSVKRNNIIYDVSISGNLLRLKQRICEG